MLFRTVMTALLIGVVGTALAAEKAPSAGTTTEKNVTILSATTSADGSTAIHTELLEECIESLPDPATLSPVVHAGSEHMQEINGEAGRNAFVKTWSAELEIAYMVRQKAMIVVSTNSIKGSEPTTQVVDKRIPRTKRFVSDPANGDSFANRSSRTYFFSTAEKAGEDVARQAASWIRLQSPITCK